MISEVSKTLTAYNAKRVLVHSDIRNGFPVEFVNRKDFIVRHMDLLQELTGNMDIWMPSFNYDFCKGTDYSIADTPSKVGPLSEYFRKEVAQWRTPVPVFSFTGTGAAPTLEVTDTIDPFDTNSAFHILNNDESLILHYGSAFHHTTFLHYLERVSGSLAYRYDKVFPGQVVFPNDEEFAVKLLFHVRPMGYHLDYDWDKITGALEAEGILHSFTDGTTHILLMNAKAMANHLLGKIADDPLYLLDRESVNWVRPKLDQLGRPFQLEDFE